MIRSNVAEESKLIVLTPEGESIHIRIVSAKYRYQLIQDDSTKLIAEIKNIAGKKPIYKIRNGYFLIGYTASSYAILVDSEDDLKKVIRNEKHDIVSLIKNKENFFYSFNLHSSLIEHMLEKNYKIVDGYGKEYRRPFNHSEPTYSKTVQFEDGSILIYFERAQNVYQGDWFPDKENFLFFYNNGYTG